MDERRPACALACAAPSSNRCGRRIWRRASGTYFRYDGLIKGHFTSGLYPAEREAFPWESLDSVLTDSQLETLPLWLLGTDHVVLEVAAALATR